MFGPAFGAAVVRVPVGQWAGPVPSSYGLHLVWVHERTPATLPPLDAIRSRVVHAVLAEQAAARLERRLAERRAP
jgi:parvulin-like peptidyl-prolyl isomerase